MLLKKFCWNKNRLTRFDSFRLLRSQRAIFTYFVLHQFIFPHLKNNSQLSKPSSLEYPLGPTRSKSKFEFRTKTEAIWRKVRKCDEFNWLRKWLSSVQSSLDYAGSKTRMRDGENIVIRIWRSPLYIAFCSVANENFNPVSFLILSCFVRKGNLSAIWKASGGIANRWPGNARQVFLLSLSIFLRYTKTC